MVLQNNIEKWSRENVTVFRNMTQGGGGERSKNYLMVVSKIYLL